ncbi:hypothetical protein M0R19_05145 [Candidatus Pacearchaeota archaeon]|jgi:hypothetical protein|nr:hypothetical protein [Candidatus Pacearchaeota archaeon]
MWRNYEEIESDEVIVKYESDTQLADLSLVKDKENIFWLVVSDEVEGDCIYVEVDDIDLMIDFFQEVVDKLKKEKAFQDS